MAVQAKVYTVDDLRELSRGVNEKRYELVKGELREVMPTGDIHTELAVWAAHLVVSYVMPRQIGVVTGEIGGYILYQDPKTGRDTVRAPDVGFLFKDRLQPPTGSFYPVAPDLAVEIVSPNDTATEIDEKIEDYFQGGTRLVWVIYPKSKRVHVYRAVDDVHIVTIDGVLGGGDVLPDFSLPVQELFAHMRE